MAKLTGPLMSMGAKGSIGKAMVTAEWRGVKYARAYSVPANPRTTAQQTNRAGFALLREMYKLAPAAVRAPWEAFASGRPFLPVNKFVGENLRLLQGQPDFANAIMSPGARGGLPPAAVVVADSVTADSVQVTVTPPTQLPDGWTIVEAAAAAHLEQDPFGIFSGPFVAGTDTTDPYVITLGGFTAADVVRAYGWVVYEKPDGKLAYSVSLNGTATIA